MKIYVDNYNVKKLDALKPGLDKYLTSTKSVIKLFSETSGVYQIEKNKTFKLLLPVITEPSIQHSYKGFSLILQNYDYIKEEVISQLPVNCLQFQETTYKYSFNKLDPRIFLFIVGVYHQQHDNAKQFIITDFHFETNNNCEGINNSQFQEEFSGFLSLLK